MEYLAQSCQCKLSKVEHKFLNLSSNYTIILSGDCFILFEHINEQNAKIVFWCSLYAITDIQIIQSLKSVTINFLEIKQNKDFIVVGNENALTMPDIFPYIKEGIINPQRATIKINIENL